MKSRGNLFTFTSDRAHEAEVTGTVTRAHFPLSSALLCANCESVYQAEGLQQCPACGSRQAVALGRGALGGNRRAG